MLAYLHSILRYSKCLISGSRNFFFLPCLPGLYNPPLYKIKVGVFRHLLNKFNRHVDDSGKTPLTSVDFTNFTPGNVDTLTSLDCAHVGEMGPSDWINTKKSRTENAKVGFNPTFAFSLNPCRWPAGDKILDSPAILADECDKSLIIAEWKIAAFCRCDKDAVSINRALVFSALRVYITRLSGFANTVTFVHCLGYYSRKNTACLKKRCKWKCAVLTY